MLIINSCYQNEESSSLNQIYDGRTESHEQQFFVK